MVTSSRATIPWRCTVWTNWNSWPTLGPRSALRGISTKIPVYVSCQQDPLMRCLPGSGAAELDDLVGLSGGGSMEEQAPPVKRRYFFWKVGWLEDENPCPKFRNGPVYFGDIFIFGVVSYTDSENGWGCSCHVQEAAWNFNDLGDIGGGEKNSSETSHPKHAAFLCTKPCPGSYDCFDSIHATTSGHLAGSFSGFETWWYSHRQLFQSHVLHQSHWSVARTAKYEGLGESGT